MDEFWNLVEELPGLVFILSQFRQDALGENTGSIFTSSLFQFSAGQESLQVGNLEQLVNQVADFFLFGVGDDFARICGKISLHMAIYNA